MPGLSLGMVCWQSWGKEMSPEVTYALILPSTQSSPHCTLQCVRLQESTRTQLFLRGIS